MQVSSLDVEGGARAVPPEEPHRPADERGGGARAEAVQVVRVQIVADPDAARRRRPLMTAMQTFCSVYPCNRWFGSVFQLPQAGGNR